MLRASSTSASRGCRLCWNRSPRRLSSVTATAATTRAAAPATPQRRQLSTVIVSRRRWDAYLDNTPPKLKVAAPKAAKTEDKPWPRYLVWTGYGLVATVVPYMAVWIGLTNESSRAFLLQQCGPRVGGILRQHFGSPEVGAVSYVDRQADGPAGIPHALLGEESFAVRQQQGHIADDCWKGDVKVRVNVHTNDTVDTTEVDLPAAVLASKEEILAKAASLAQSLASAPGGGEGAVVSVDFVSQPKKAPTSLDDNNNNNNNNDTMGDNNNEFATVDNAVDPLRRTAPVYSLWHYQPTAAAPTASGASAGTAADQDFQVERLRAGISRLEAELQNSATGTRPIDDVVEELQLHKAELRRLGWQKWKPW
jgi:hypothetical protein